MTKIYPDLQKVHKIPNYPYKKPGLTFEREKLHFLLNRPLERYFAA